MKKQKLLNTKLVDRINIPTIPVLVQLQGDETITDVNVLDGYIFDAKSIRQAIKDLEFEHNDFSKKYPYLFDDRINITRGNDNISITGSQIILNGSGYNTTTISNSQFGIIHDRNFSRIVRSNSTKQNYFGKGTITSYTDQNDTYIKIQESSNSLTIDEKGINISGKTNEDLLNANGGTISIPELKVQLDISDYLTKTEYNNEKLIISGTGEESMQSNFDNTSASGKRSIAFNRKSSAVGQDAASIGFGCNATGTGALTIGRCSSSNQYGISLGGLSYAGTRGFAVGNHVMSSNLNLCKINITKDSNTATVVSLPDKFKKLIPPFKVYINATGKLMSHEICEINQDSIIFYDNLPYETGQYNAYFPCTIASGDYSFAAINGNASGPMAIAIGYLSEASGESATAIGNSTKSVGYGAVSLGVNSIANGNDSLATGYSSVAYGTYSTAIGQSSFSGAYNSITFGSNQFVGFDGQLDGNDNTKITVSINANNDDHYEYWDVLNIGQHIYDIVGNKTRFIGTIKEIDKQNNVITLEKPSKLSTISNVLVNASIATGNSSIARAGVAKGHHSVCFCEYGLTKNRDEVAFGVYNKSNSNTIFSIGNGSTKKRNNALELTTDGKLYLDTLPEGEDIVSYIDSKIINYEFIMSDNAHNLQVIQQLNQADKLDAMPVYLVYVDGAKEIGNFTNGHIDIVSNGFLYEYNVDYNTGEIVQISTGDIIHGLAYYHLEIGNSDVVKASNMEYLTGHQGQFFCEIDYGYGVGTWHAITGGQATIMTAYGDHVQYIISGDGVVTRSEDNVAGFDTHTRELNMTVANISIGTAVTNELAIVIEKASSICGIPGFNSQYTRFLRQDGAGDIIKFAGFMTHASDDSTIINTIKYNKTTKTFTY